MRRFFLLTLPGLVPAAIAAAPAAHLDEVVVTATRAERTTFEIPAAVSVRDIRRDTLGANLSESLVGVPGLVARDRQNYAQDTQISIRGFGARSTFGIRGVRLYVDGIPATQPDGQGQVSHFNLATAASVEVLRGPFSALYGNSSGGVIALQTEDGSGAPAVSAGATWSDHSTWRADLGSNGAQQGRNDAVDYRVGYSHFQTEGTRGHSAARRESLQAKLRVARGRSRLTLLANVFDSPDAQDPLGLTQAQYDADAKQTAPTSVQFNTRKSASQNQFGAVYDRTGAAAGDWRLMSYVGTRRIQQFLAVPVATQADARHSGGVVALSTDFSGAEARWSRGFEIAGRPLNLVAGMTIDVLDQQRRGYENFLGATLGVVGALRRDETNQVRSGDEYLQLEWSPASRWLLLGGVRHSTIRFSSSDRYIVANNPDDSGRVSYAVTAPVLSVLWRTNALLHVYAAYGQGFETPTLVELAYRSDGAPGLNFDLRAARTNNAEVGAKWRPNARWQVEGALFSAATRNELVVVRNSGGRAAFANATRTRRRGAELSVSATLTPVWRWQLAYTALQATVVDSYRICTTVPCVIPNASVAAGSRLPGVPSSNFYQQLRWGRDTGWQGRIEVRYLSEIFASDQNTVRAEAYGAIDLGASFIAVHGGGTLETYLRVENLANRQYSGSLIVNEANARYFEPAPGRTVLAGLSFRPGAARG